MTFRLTARLALAGLALVMSATANAAPITAPTGLIVGEQYRLAFITSGVTPVSSTDIATYDAFVTAQANTISELAALNTQWRVIGGTASVNLRDHTDTVPSSVTGGSLGVPIYLLNGVQLVDSYDDLWDGSIDVPLNVDESGATFVSTLYQSSVATGSAYGTRDGTTYAGRELGSASGPILGDAQRTDVGWAGAVGVPPGGSYHLYAISDLITYGAAASGSVPLPTPLMLFGAGLVAATIKRRIRSSGD
ncbi:MAG: hypothetical protein H6980_08850 [Gammaproteobacteria bacterium]|nr:hypothetical protein [Gammaproteobacteria bacterium]